MTINELKYLITTKIYTNGIEDITAEDLQQVLLVMADSAFTDVIDRLDVTRVDAALSANQGKILNDKITSILNDTSDIHLTINSILSELLTLSDNIATEVNDRKTADTAILVSLDNEITNRTNGDISINTALTKEIQDRKDADTAINTTITSNVNTINGKINTLTNNLTAEAAIREQADTALGVRIDNETTNRINYDQRLDDKISTEATDRKNGDIQIQLTLNNEIEERKSDVNALNTRVTIEVQDRTNADKLLNQRIDNLPVIDLTPYYTKDEVDDLIDNIEAGEVDLSDYYTKEQVDEAIDEAVTGGTVDLSNYYTKTDADALLNNKADKSTTYNKTEVDSKFTPYYTSAQVDSKIAAIPTVDLTNYYDKDEIDDLLDNLSAGDVDLTNYYTKLQADSLLSNKANVGDSYTKTEVDGKIAAIPATDLSNYYTKTEVDSLIPDLSNYYTNDEIDNLLLNKASAIDVAGKQDRLTAGTNITIAGNVISAKDTVYDDTALQLMVSQKQNQLVVSDGLNLDSTRLTLDIQHVILTQAEFDALTTKSTTTIYYIKG
ncbi:MAG: hypothetical protein LBV71_16100 [Prevotella sp.]|jgi:hypothetical protein|nr:hypothetical protein [Prevotella sp.]